MYQIHTLKVIRRDLKKLTKQAAAKIAHFALPQISKNPYCGAPLSGDLKGLWKYVFRFKGVSYRIVYQILEKEKVVLIIAIGPREKFYERLLKRVR